MTVRKISGTAEDSRGACFKPVGDLQEFINVEITERKLGYILAAIEYQYQKIVWLAEDELSSGKINQDEFDKIVKEAKFNWLGK